MPSGQQPEVATATETDGTKQPADTAAAPATAAAAVPDADVPPKKLSGAELKALKQAEKAKRRAAVIAAKEAVAGGAGPVGAAPPTTAAQAGKSSSSTQKQGKAKGGQNAEGGSSAGAGSKITGQLVRRPSSTPGAASAATATVATAAAAAASEAASAEREKNPRAGIPECFSHLPMAKRISIAQAHKDVHPAVLAVGQQMASFVLRDNVARLEATLVAFKKVIESYQTPPGNAFSRHFVSHVLNPQIEYLTECRPMCFAMGNGIRLLKARVSQLDLDTDDFDAVTDLCDSIDGFIHERIFVAAVGIAREAASMIHDGDVILTYGGPRLVRAALEQAWNSGIRFDLIVVDDSSDPAAGQSLVKQFQKRSAAAAAKGAFTYVSYSPSLDSIDSQIARATTVFLGVEAVFANGALLAPAGTNDVVLAAQASGCSVITLCETVNFDRDRAATDALAHNEIDPDRCSSQDFRLLFDITQSSSVNMLICEYEEASGMTPAHAIYQVTRTREDPN